MKQLSKVNLANKCYFKLYDLFENYNSKKIIYITLEFLKLF